MSAQAMLRLIKAAAFTPTKLGWGLSVGFVGDSGVAKSGILEGFAASWGMHGATLEPGASGEGAFGVIAVPKDGVLTYPPVEKWHPFVGDSALPLILLVDELTTAEPLIQAACLGLFGKHEMGGHRFGRNVRVFAAWNPPELAANGHAMSGPNANRVMHIPWVMPTVAELARHHALSSLDDEEPAAPKDWRAEQQRVLDAWPVAWSRTVGLWAAFMGAAPSFLHRRPKEGDPALSGAWPSPRSWELAMRGYASALVHGETDEERDEIADAFVTGAVGAEAAQEWADHRRKAELPCAADVLDGKVTFDIARTRTDIVDAFLAEAIATVTPATAERRVERADALWGILSKVSTVNFDIVVPIALDLHRAKLGSSKAARALSDRVYKVQAA